jgi:N-acetylmuramoyl-L-alanine amidase
VILLAALSCVAPRAASAADSGPSVPPGVAQREVHVHAPAGPLAGLVVHLSAGHGMLLQRNIRGEVVTWAFQRDLRYGIREDLFTASFAIDELAPTLEAAGATVLMLRERDRGEIGALIDDADAGFSIEGNGAWQADPLAWGAGARVLDDTARASFVLPAMPAGEHRVYARWVAGPDRSSAARYTVEGSTSDEIWTVDQRIHGGIWWPLGAIALDEGAAAVVTLDGDGGRLSADAVRIGGGTASPGPGYPPAPLWEVAPSHRFSTLGGPFQLLWLPDGAESSDIRFRARWASSVSPPPEDAVYLSIHTNAGRGHGTELYEGVETSPVLPSLPSSVALLDALHAALVDATLRVDPTWYVEMPERGDFSEVSPQWQQLPSALVEMGFHDSPADAKWLLNPTFRQAFADGIRDALVVWRATRPTGPPPAIAPSDATDAPIREGHPPPDRPRPAP